MQQRLEEVKPIAEQQLRDWERQATELNQPNRKFLLAEPILKLVPSYRELIKENTRLKQIITQEIKQLKYEVRKQNGGKLGEGNRNSRRALPRSQGAN